MQIVFDTYKKDSKEYVYSKVLENEDKKATVQNATAIDRMLECKKEKRRKASEKLIFEYCLLSDRFLRLYSLDNRFDIMRCLKNYDLLNTLRRDLIFALSDLYCQHISYQDACTLIEAEETDEYDDGEPDAGKIPHSEEYRETWKIGKSAVSYLEMLEKIQMRNGGFPQFNSGVNPGWSKGDDTESMLARECQDITSSHIRMVKNILAMESSDNPSKSMIGDIQRKLVMAIASECGIAISDEEIERILSLDGIILSESEMKDSLVKTAIIGKEAINYCCNYDEL